VDAILDMMYNDLDNPAYEGNPIHPLNFVDALIRGDDWAFEPELYAGLKTGLSPILFPEDTTPNIAAHTTSEILDDHASGSHSKSAFLHHLTVSGSGHLVSQTPSLTRGTAKPFHIFKAGAGSKFLCDPAAGPKHPRQNP